MAGWSPETWSALAAWTTALVAIIAVVVAFHQVREARRLRREQAQPYVAIYLEPTEVDRGFIDLVVKNFGQTIAREIRITIEPKPRQAAGNGPRDLWVPKKLSALVPGQEWRTFWDYLPRRKDAELPDVHRASVKYRDSRGEIHQVAYELDFRPLIRSGALVQYGMHHAAKSLREIEKKVGRWGEGISRGLAVTVRDGDRKDAERAGEEPLEKWWREGGESETDAGEDSSQSDS